MESVESMEEHKKIAIMRQAKLLRVSKSSYYYKPPYKEEELELMHCIDAIYAEHPYYGSRRIYRELQKK